MTVAPGASRRRHGRTRWGFRCGRLFVAFGVDLRDDVMHVLLDLSDHFAGFLPHLVGAADRRLDQRAHGIAEPRQVFRDQHRGDAEHKAGQQGSLENDHTAPTTATVAAVATSSSWLSANSSKPSAGSFASLSAVLPPFAASDLCRSMEFLSSALDQGALAGTRDWSRILSRALFRG